MGEESVECKRNELCVDSSMVRGETGAFASCKRAARCRLLPVTMNSVQSPDRSAQRGEVHSLCLFVSLAKYEARRSIRWRPSSAQLTPRKDLQSHSRRRRVPDADLEHPSVGVSNLLLRRQLAQAHCHQRQQVAHRSCLLLFPSLLPLFLLQMLPACITRFPSRPRKRRVFKKRVFQSLLVNVRRVCLCVCGCGACSSFLAEEFISASGAKAEETTWSSALTCVEPHFARALPLLPPSLVK